MRFTGVPTNKVDAFLPLISDALRSCCDRMHGRYDLDSLKKLIRDGELQLWISYDNEAIQALCLTEIVVYPHKKYCRIVAGTGNNHSDWNHYRSVIEDWAMANGCNGMESFARPGWERVFKDYKKTHVILEKDFDHGISSPKTN